MTITRILKSTLINAVFYLYESGWRIAIPFLKNHSRISDGFDQRRLTHSPKKADIWIQSASAGEAYLTTEILKHFHPKSPVSLFLTSNTRQGIDILTRAVEELTESSKTINAVVSFSPFDQPSLMKQAVNSIQPKLMVLVELEIWPGLLKALKHSSCKTLIVNGRLTPKSLRGYMKWPSLWDYLAPGSVLAISENDADRFRKLFPGADVQTMPNIKFDRFSKSLKSPDNTRNPLQSFLPSERPIVVLGSVREEEESDIETIITNILSICPDALICLFPRHMHRLEYWQQTLGSMPATWQLRSLNIPVQPETSVVLWDTFGELTHAYDLACTAFVGGSLAPLGGQNFLEPLACGVIPVIGPSWGNFEWVGETIIASGLLYVEPDTESVARRLVERIKTQSDKNEIRKMAASYINARKGGITIVCNTLSALSGDQ